MFKCSATGREYRNTADGIFDDGEFISWDWLNQFVDPDQHRIPAPAHDPVVAKIFDEVVTAARRYHETTGRYLQLWGELAELYVEIHHGLKRHRPCAQGSDGKIGNDFVEVKAISPEKRDERIEVSAHGNFSKLVVVKISADLKFESRILDRSALQKNPSRLRSNWNAMERFPASDRD